MIHRAKTSPYELAIVANDFPNTHSRGKGLFGFFKTFLRRERPDWLILNGDFEDGSALDWAHYAAEAGAGRPKNRRRATSLARQKGRAASGHTYPNVVTFMLSKSRLRGTLAERNTVDYPSN